MKTTKQLSFSEAKRLGIKKWQMHVDAGGYSELVFTDKELNPKRLYLFSSFVAILIALIFEDLDAYELMPFYFGIILWQFYRMKDYETVQA